MEMQRKALYNLLRLNWLLEPDIDVAYWQVEDYRSLSIETLFKRLEKQHIDLDRNSFLAFAESYSSPEELAEDLTEEADESDESIQEQDRAYLLIFELWRRLAPEKLCLSVFCDELDYQVSLYDSGEMENAEGLQDALASLQDILDQNVDEGASSEEAFVSVVEGCANNIEDFIYDFTADQIDSENDTYAFELIEGFYPYVEDKKWFDFLKARLLLNTDTLDGNRLLRKLLDEASEDEDLEFHLEVLSSMIDGGERDLFVKLVESTIPLIELEEEFQELLGICAEYYQRLDYDWEEKEIHKILDQRQTRLLDAEVHAADLHKGQLLTVVLNRGV